MPGALRQWHELNQLAITSDQQMRRHLEPANLIEIGMRVPVKAIREQGLDFRSAELARRQADSMLKNELRLAPIGPGVAVAAGRLASRADHSTGDINVELAGHGDFSSGMISKT